MDVSPYAVPRAGLTLNKHRLLTVASLAYSADWLAHEAGGFKCVECVWDMGYVCVCLCVY